MMAKALLVGKKGRERIEGGKRKVRAW